MSDGLDQGRSSRDVAQRRSTAKWSVYISSVTESLKFDFVADEALRRGLEADYAELTICAEHGAWKAVHVLAGSLLEAVLVEYVGASGSAKKDPAAMTLGELIEAGKKARVVSDRAATLSGALKSYRNLIHPGRALRLGESADEDGATVALALVRMIVNDVAATQRRLYGLTADQIVNKVAGDSTAVAIVQHLLKAAPEPELARLILVALPTAYFEELESEFFADKALLDRYAVVYRAAFEMASAVLKGKAMHRYATVLREESANRVLIYEQVFFRASDLDNASEGDRRLATDHLLDRIKREPNPELLQTAKGIGSFLCKADVTAFVDPLVRLSVTAGDHSMAKRASELLKDEALLTPSELDPLIVRRIRQWEALYASRNEADKVAALVDLRFMYEISLP